MQLIKPLDINRSLHFLNKIGISKSSMEALFRIAFYLVLGCMIAMQVYFAFHARQAERRTKSANKTIMHEGRFYFFARVFRSSFLLIFLLLYAVNLPWLSKLRVPFPEWLRWTGIGLSVVSCIVYAWSRATIGKEWSSLLRTSEQHRLVTNGPYAWTRHPIYFSIIGFLSGLALIAANWILIAILVFSIVDLNLRIQKEERMMIGVFGEEYVMYMRTTGGLFPTKNGLHSFWSRLRFHKQ